MKEEGADEVSCPEKTLRLWLKPLLPLNPPPQAGDKSKEGGPFWKHKQVSDSQGSGGQWENFQRWTPIPIVHLIQHSLIHMHIHAPWLKWAFVISCLLSSSKVLVYKESMNSFTEEAPLLGDFLFCYYFVKLVSNLFWQLKRQHSHEVKS